MDVPSERPILKRPTMMARCFYVLGAIFSGLIVWRLGGAVWEGVGGLGAVVLIAIAFADGKRRVGRE
jgi:hypothetical protein